MKNKYLITGGIIASLLTSNVVTNVQYKKDVAELNQKNNSLVKTIDNKNSMIKHYQNDINTYKNQLSELNSKRKELNKRIDKLEDKLDEANKARLEYPSVSSYGNKRVLTVTATAYTSKCKGCSGITSSGYNVRNTVTYNGMRIVAMDTNLVKQNSIIQIDTRNGSYTAIVLDKGGAIRGHKLDFLTATTEEANQFGLQKNVKVTVLKEG